MKESHIQMPKLILKRFADKKQTLHYVDCKSGEIRKGYAASLYTEYGYYSDAMEEWLNREIETPLGEYVKFIETTDFSTPKDIRFDYVDYSYKYLYSLLARSPYMLDIVSNNSVLLQFMEISETDKHDMVAHDTYMMLVNKNMFQDSFVVSLVDNKTEEPFVLATSGICQCRIGIICPLTPKRALLFKHISREDRENEIPLFEVDNIDIIETINRLQYEQEKKYVCKYVVSNSKESLLKIIPQKKGI